MLLFHLSCFTISICIYWCLFSIFPFVLINFVSVSDCQPVCLSPSPSLIHALFLFLIYRNCFTLIASLFSFLLLSFYISRRRARARMCVSVCVCLCVCKLYKLTRILSRVTL